MQEDAVATAASGTILDRDGVFWKRFIFNGVLNESAILEAKYSEKQIPEIKARMQKLGWL